MKKRIFSSFLALITLLALLPTAMAASFPPSDSPYWTSVSDQEGYNMLSSLSKSGDLVFVFYGTDCPRSARQVPEMADYLNEIGVHAYAFSCAQGESSQVAYAISRMFNSLPAWPVVVLYSASSGKVGAYGNCDLEHLKEGLQNYGLYDVSNDPGSDDSDGDNGDNSLPLYYDSSIDSAAWEVLRLTNQHRMSMGLDPLSTTDAMQMAANQRAEELTVQYNADHSRPDGSECYTVLKDYGISYNSAAENIAYGYSSATAVMDGWLNSSGHRKNIETASLVHLGVGHASNYWAQDFIGSSSCSYSSLSLSRSSVTGEVGQDLEDILTGADITVTANCSKHGASYLPLIADMCTGYRADTAGTQTITVSLDGRSTTLTVTLAANCTEHVYDSGTVTKAATCTAEGVMTYTCVICGETKTETIPKTAHTPNSQGVCTVCGQTVSTPSTQQPTTTQQPATVPAGESTGAVGQTGTLAAGDFHAGAIDQNGALWMWGYGSYGRLGTGTAENAPYPGEGAGQCGFRQLRPSQHRRHQDRRYPLDVGLRQRNTGRYRESNDRWTPVPDGPCEGIGQCDRRQLRPLPHRRH